MATKAFIVANHLGRAERYTPRPVTYNGKVGYLWECHVLECKRWIYQTTRFHPARATRKTIGGY